MKRAAIYLRISSDPKLERLGVERQREDCLALASSRGYEVAHTVEDNDTSAAGKRARPGFERLCRLVEAGEVEVIIAWAFDRLTRNRHDQLRLMELGQAHRTVIHLCRGTDMDLSTPAGRMSADILASVARNEIEVKSERQTRANQQRVAMGKRVAGGRRSFGYTQNNEVIPHEAEAIRDGYRWLLDGVSLKEIARRWNDAGLLTPQRPRGAAQDDSSRNEWEGGTVSRCLRKPIYAGLLMYRGKVQGEGMWERIIDPATYAQAMALMTSPHRKPPKGRQHLLTGVALCGLCGATVHARGGKTGLGVYSCSGPVKHLTRKREPIDQFVEAVIIDYLSRPEAADAFRPTDEDTATRAAEVTERLADIRSRLDGLATALAQGILDLPGVTRESNRLRAEQAELEKQLELHDPAVGKVQAIVSSDDVAAVWNGLDIDTRRSIIGAFFTVTLHRPVRGARSFDPATVTVNLKSS